MSSSDDNNLTFATSHGAVDVINAEFYGRIRFPWPPAAIDRVTDDQFWTRMMSEDLGGAQPLPRSGGHIWVAGCGSNQGLITALKFPNAQVVGSDLSAESLDTCRRNAAQLGVTNLELVRESLNGVEYAERFDYVLCTGVIHHNADPAIPLRNLARALKPGGALELMVYNKYHRITTTAFQKAVRTLLGGTAPAYDFDAELATAKAIAKSFAVENFMGTLLAGQREAPDAAFADALIQPVEYSYTVESLGELANTCGLELLSPCVNQFDVAQGTFDWEFDFHDAELQTRYERLSDVERWQVSNLLLLERSPMLWFYARRTSGTLPRRSTAQLCDRFTSSRFEKVHASRRIHRRRPDGTYDAAAKDLPFPGSPRDPEARRVFDALRPGELMGDALRRLGVAQSLHSVNRLRQLLATSGFPFLRREDAKDGAL